MGNRIGGRRKAGVEERYTRLQGLYENRDIDQKKLRKLILEARLAPCYPGANDAAGGDLEGCPICYLYYPSLNRSKCCSKGMCTECFLNMKPTHTARPTLCPFCKTPHYAVEYHGVKTEEERSIEQFEEQKVIEAQMRMAHQALQDEEDKMKRKQSKCSSSTTIAPTTEVEYRDICSTSYSVPSYRCTEQETGCCSSEPSCSAQVNMRPFHSRHTRDDSIDMNIADMMVMEAIWRPIQDREPAPVIENIGTIGSLIASQESQGEISSPQQPMPGLPLPGTPSSSSEMPGSQMRCEPHYLSLHQLKQITKDFSEEEIIGRGGSCVVYKGELHDGTMIAVKKIEQMWSSKGQWEKAQKQFDNEVNLLMEIKHPNIVKLLGHCYEIHSAPLAHDGTYIFCWKRDSLLCLEFLPKSLDKYISDATSGLDWHTRYKIIEGISYGLQYLHEQSDIPVIHLDLKPGNILLDENMVPKIADFGISRLFDQGQTIHTKNTHGTPGYMPPEFIQAGIITLMSDIFSLGVMILEVITGHRDYPLDLKASSEEFINTELSKWRNMLEKEPGNANIETDCQQIEKCIQIGLMCLNPDRTKRPTMRKITNILQGLESTTEYGPLLGRVVLGREQGCIRYLHHVLIVGICATIAFLIRYDWWK